MAERGGAFKETQHSFEYAAQHGRGGVYIKLTAQQYEKLKRSWRGLH